ncbi:MULTISPECIES: ABC transporter substrate-binding protein [unclassified Bradyrhizobium]|uniref:ABC transporter substrate-binding protein n=1 Tax=unclassified Bradyrhizobium TaxID=2631580 RepID=UPI0015CD3057|nr:MULTISPECIES: ABC transporter substrate-binding protein [unclassified Bradyrhizobium]
MQSKSLTTACIALTWAIAYCAPEAFAQKKYDPGATDTEIKVGNIMPYSGPASSYSLIGRTQAAYFQKVNDEGGINGRKLVFISYDDAYSPPKAVEQARKLVEKDEVLLIFSPLGGPSNLAIQKYLNSKKIPQLFVATGTTRWGDPKHFPWTMGFQPNYQSEGRIYAKDILQNHPNAKIAVLWQNDDTGRDQVKGLRDGLGDKASMIIADASFEVTDPTIDSQIARLRDSGADIFVYWGIQKAAAQAIRKIAELRWKPVFYLSSTSSSIGTVLQPAGFENSMGIISAGYLKDPTDPDMKTHPDVLRYHAFLDKYLPQVDKSNNTAVYGYASAELMVEVLRRCSDNLTRENVMKQASSLKQLKIEMLLDGVTVTTGPDDFFPIEQMQLMKFDGQRWKFMDGLIDGAVGSAKGD